MTPKLLHIVSDAHEGSLTIAFPSRVVSTNVDAMREQLGEFYNSIEMKTNSWHFLELDLKKTEFVDSIGLNMIFDLVKLAQDKEAKIVAWITSRALRLILYTVRLDKKMDIRLIELPPAQS